MSFPPFVCDQWYALADLKLHSSSGLIAAAEYWPVGLCRDGIMRLAHRERLRSKARVVDADGLGDIERTIERQLRSWEGLIGMLGFGTELGRSGGNRLAEKDASGQGL